MSNAPAATRPRSQIDMPPLHARGAPKKFTGRAHEVTKFLAHYEKLFTLNNVFDDIEKVESMGEYCSRNVLHTLEGMKHYTTPNWAVLRTNMEHMFDADKDLQRHKPTDLRKLTDKWRRLPIKNMGTWRKYLRHFTTIAGWLLQKEIIDETDYARFLWKGIHSCLRHLIEDRLLSQKPKRDMTVPFTEDEIVGIVDAKFKRGRFDNDLESGTSDSDDSNNESDSDDSESNDSDTDDDIEYKKKKKKSKSSKAKPVLKKKVRRPKETHTSPPGIIHKPAAVPAPAAHDSEDVGDLVKRLSKMSLNDQEYSYLYYKATSLDPLVAKWVRAPNLTVNAPPPPPLPQNNFRNNRYVAPPPNQFGPNPNANQPQSPLQPGDRTCWGCGEKGHGLWECPSMAEPISNGELRRGERGLEWKDGSLLRRFNQQGETLHHAYLWQRAEHIGQPAPAAQNNLTYTTMASTDVPHSAADQPILPVFVQSTTSDDELNKMFSVTRSSAKVEHPAPYERPNTRAHVKKEGVQLEGIPDSVKATKKLAEATVEREPIETSIPVQHPVDEIDHRVDFSHEDIIMEDNGTDHPEHVLKTDQSPKLSKRAGPRQSAVSAFVDPQDILNQVLNSKMENISTGQLLAISPLLSNALIKVLQLKNSSRGTTAAHLVNEIFNLDRPTPDADESVISSPTKPESIVAATFIIRDRQRLIRLQVLINGKTVIAIVDTGSMLNMVSRPAWRTYMSHHSMDITRHINMGDANGGQAQLRGYLKDVSMVMGGVETTASFWVGEKVPFEVLLGRPWQRGNFVSIEERCDGTYLVFKDPETEDNQYKLLVDEGESDPDSTSNLADASSTMPGTYMMEIRTPAPVLESTTDGNTSETSIEPASTAADDSYESIVARLQNEIFENDSDSDSSHPSMPDLETIPPSPVPYSAHPPHAQHEPRIWPMQSPICPTCEVIIHAGLFENVNDWNTELGDFSQDANYVLQKIAESQPNSGLQDVTVHTYYHQFCFLQNSEVIEQPMDAPHATYLPLLVTNPTEFANLYPSDSLSTITTRRRMQGFLIMHPELVWLGIYFRLTPQAFVQRINALLDKHLFSEDEPTTAVAPILGWTEKSLALSDQSSTGQFDLRRIGSNPNCFLQIIRHQITGSLTDHDICLMRPQLIPHAIYTEQDPMDFLHSILCLLRHLPEFSLVFTGHLPPSGLLFNVSLAPILSTEMSDGVGSFAIERTYSPMYSPLSTDPPRPSSPSSVVANTTDDDLERDWLRTNHTLYQPYDSSSHYRMPSRRIGDLVSADGSTSGSTHSRVASTGVEPSRERSDITRIESLINIDPLPASRHPIAQRIAPMPIITVPTVPSMSSRSTVRCPAPGSCFSCGGLAHILDTCPNDRGPPEQHAIPHSQTQRERMRRTAPMYSRPRSPVITRQPTIDPTLLAAPAPARSYLWDPSALKSTMFRRLKQYCELAISFSDTYSEIYPRADDVRLTQRKRAWLADNQFPEGVEKYYNYDRQAELPKICVLMLKEQWAMEERDELPHTRLPGTALITNYLRVQDLPPRFARLDDPSMVHADWQPFICILYEIISAHSEQRVVKSLIAYDNTPIHLQVIPFSNNYVINRDDLMVKFHATTRHLLERFIAQLAIAMTHISATDSQTLDNFRDASKIRNRHTARHEFPTIFLESTSLPHLYPHDHNLTNQHHPFLHEYEVTFIDAATRELAWETRGMVTSVMRTLPYQELYRMTQKLLSWQSPYHGELSRMFQSGVFTMIPTPKIFEGDFDVSPDSSRPMTPEGMGTSEMGSN
ncbi:hypothetical protein C8R46DRAFT_1222148 [Mycena filopes]|nr:hypothetical protein C8R46DRAFT_1222148 [Mycena filopes]